MTAHPELQRHFIMVQAHGNVVALGGVLDRTPDFLMCGREDDTEHGKLDFKVHYRIVYEEIGTPLVWAEPLRNIFGALKQAIDGVAAMHRAGWLHRDLNPWSILVVNKVAKVTDLGYAVAASEQTRYEDVGTALFRSTEVDHGCYRCQLEPSASRARIRRRLKPTKAGSDPKATHPDSKTGTGTITPSDLDLQNGSDAPSDSEVHISSDEWRFVNDPRDEWAFELVHEPGTLPPPENLITEGSNETRSGFCYNSLHDLESLWWIAVYFAVWAGANDCGPPHLPHEFRERKQQRRTDVVQVRQDESKNAVASEVDKSSTTAISANPTEAAPPASVQNTASHPPATTSTARGSSNAPLTLSRPRHPALAYFHSERGSARSDVWTKSNAFMRQMHGLLPRLALEPVVALLEGARVSLCAAHERASRERLGYVLRSREPESEIEEHRRIRIFFSAAQAALLDRKLMLPKLGLGWM
ncbi:hypothetical protein NM688_g4639 [Phlebia brevispora]|uniref:Uncharacterized protein n=1 Tax=Phlebia brevispora TaxID=194682 RepID=A0ACC1T2I8_9APHY|nr:hypothetical protein NM688_g4639 [Phlebia brevispora]